MNNYCICFIESCLGQLTQTRRDQGVPPNPDGANSLAGGLRQMNENMIEGQSVTSSVSYRITLPVEIHVLFPEETFTPVPVVGQTECISLNGLKLILPEVDAQFYRQLVRGVRHTRLKLTNPLNNEPMRLAGRIDWFDFHDNREGRESCYIAVSLFKKDLGDCEQYAQMLEGLLSGGRGALRKLREREAVKM